MGGTSKGVGALEYLGKGGTGGGKEIEMGGSCGNSLCYVLSPPFLDIPIPVSLDICHQKWHVSKETHCFLCSLLGGK